MKQNIWKILKNNGKNRRTVEKNKTEIGRKQMRKITIIEF